VSEKPVVKFSWEGAEQRRAEQEEKIRLDYNSDVYASKEGGIKEGVGWEKIEIAKRLLKIGLDTKQIARATGLTDGVWSAERWSGVQMAEEGGGQSPEMSDIIKKLIDAEEGIARATRALLRVSKNESSRLLAGLDERLVQRYQSEMQNYEQEGIKQGINQERKETAKRLLDMGLTADQITQATGLTEDQVKSLA
jgi:CRISPR/Cas system CSM-associated protein Csm2 small subunit